jgi:hypothetical protein
VYPFTLFDLIYGHRDSHVRWVDFNDSNFPFLVILFFSCSISLYVCALVCSLLALPTELYSTYYYYLGAKIH